jgi:two-component system response regulator AtoC
MTGRPVLIVDDERAVRYALEQVLRAEGHEVLTAASGVDALKLLQNQDIELVITDLAMPGMNGLELMAHIKAHDAAMPVVLITAHGSERVAVDAMRAGAYDYIPKPFDNDHVAAVVSRAVEARRLRLDNRRMAAERILGKRLVAESLPMRRLLDSAARVATRDVTVLVRGETGVGKELIGAYIHVNSPRNKKPLVRFNCAAIPGDLAESELFGHAKGAFTGANTAHRGFFAEADGGTLILDEVGELPLAVQAKLLRALQEGEIQPVGLGRVQKVDVRVIASTNRDLLADAKAGTFREDLYYRLAVVELVIPPLRDRRDDIAPLAYSLVSRYGERFGVPNLHFAPGVVDVLAKRDWPGNVRELDNTIARLAALASSDAITLADVAGPPTSSHNTGESEMPPSSDALLATTAPSPATAPSATGTPSSHAGLRAMVEAYESTLIAAMLAETDHNQSEAARRLQVSRVTLIDKMRKYGLA